MTRLRSYSARMPIGYLLSIVTAVITFNFLFSLKDISKFESATNNTFTTKLSHYVVMALITDAIGLIFAFGLTILPCILLGWITTKFFVRRLMFYLVAGMTVGGFSALTFDFLWRDNFDNMTLLEILKFNSVYFLLSGVFAGLIYWRTAGRYNVRRECPSIE